MTTINDFIPTDDVHDVLARWIADLIPTSLRSEYKNTETLSADRALLDADTPIQRLDCGGTNRTVYLPEGNAVENHPYLIVNASDDGETITVRDYDDTTTLTTLAEGGGALFLPDGAGGYVMASGGGDVTPYRIAVSVSSNNLTLALKNKNGDDPSPSSPVRVQIGDTVREITAPLSVTVNAGANTFNAGSSELATKEIDYFPMLAWVSASSVVAIGYSRIPFGRIGSNFSGTATSEKYAAWSTAPGASDPVQVIGRFAATLSAGAGYTWSVPTFTAENLIHEPVNSSRVLEFTPQITYDGGTTSPTSNTPSVSRYFINDRTMVINITSALVRGSGNRTVTVFTIPFSSFIAFTSPFTGLDSVTAAGLRNTPSTYISGGAIYFLHGAMADNGNYFVTAIHTMS